MIFVIYNVIGLVIALIGTAVALPVARLTPDNFQGPGALTLGVVWIITDLVYRFRKGRRRVFDIESGGQLFFIPMWCWGIVCLWIGAGMLQRTIAQRHDDELHRQRILHNGGHL